MLASGFLSSSVPVFDFCACTCSSDWPDLGPFPPFGLDLCRGRGATKISVSGLTSTAVVGFVGGFVSSDVGQQAMSVRVVTVYDKGLVRLTDDEADLRLPVDPDTDSSVLI